MSIVQTKMVQTDGIKVFLTTEPDLYLVLTDPDPGGPKTYRTDPDPQHCFRQ